MKATAKSLRITPKKLNLIADLIRNKDAVEAMEILDFLPKKGAKVLNKVVTSAVANAKTNFKQDESSLYIKRSCCIKGTSFKRWIQDHADGQILE
ncbi:MAG: uL22 family ribosomal protein [Candidatus Gracilibacteria bacterium]